MDNSWYIRLKNILGFGQNKIVMFEWLDGTKHWYQHNKRHRDDGPAVEWPNGAKTWYLYDQRLSFDEWLDKVKMSDEGKVMMKLQYG
jgi:hypothetical protein